MENKQSRLDELKKMLELGVISEQEYQILVNQAQSNQPNSNKSQKRVLIISAAAILLLLVLFWLFSGKDQEKEVQNLSKAYVSCQLENNLAYINALYDLSEQINNGTYTFATQIDSVLQVLDAKYQNQEFNSSVAQRYREYEKQETAALSEWPRTSPNGKTFWTSFDQKIELNSELNSSNKRLEDLLEQVEELKLSLSMGSMEELNEKKQFVFNRLEALFGIWNYEYFDPYEYFSYRVQQFLGKKNTNPNDIQLYINQQANIGGAEFSPILETLTLKKKEGEGFIWEFATDYKYYNENTQTYLTCNKWYSVLLNKQDKIEILKELKIENKKEISAEEYNAMNLDRDE